MRPPASGREPTARVRSGRRQSEFWGLRRGRLKKSQPRVDAQTLGAVVLPEAAVEKEAAFVCAGRDASVQTAARRRGMPVPLMV